MQPAIRSYRDLVVWQKAVQLVVGTHELTATPSRGRDRELGAQMRRAAVSIASNIAEGHGRDHLGDYLRHLSFAKGSVTELETQLLISRAIASCNSNDVERLLALCDEIGRMLSVLSRKLKLKLASRTTESADPAPKTQHPAPAPTAAPQQRSEFDSPRRP